MLLGGEFLPEPGLLLSRPAIPGVADRHFGSAARGANIRRPERVGVVAWTPRGLEGLHQADQLQGASEWCAGCMSHCAQHPVPRMCASATAV